MTPFYYLDWLLGWWWFSYSMLIKFKAKQRVNQTNTCIDKQTTPTHFHNVIFQLIHLIMVIPTHLQGTKLSVGNTWTTKGQFQPNSRVTHVGNIFPFDELSSVPSPTHQSYPTASIQALFLHQPIQKIHTLAGSGKKLEKKINTSKRVDQTSRKAIRWFTA